MSESLPNGVELGVGKGGMRRVVVTNAHATVEVYLLGATVTHFEPTGRKPVLFVSRQAVYEPGKAIRGGVPICWPWFGPHPSDPKQPQHGPVRRAEWSVVGGENLTGGATRVTFGLTTSDASLRYDVTVGPSLVTRLGTTNASDRPITITEALHTYLAVGDVRQIGIEGLGGIEYVERSTRRRQTQTDPVIRFTGEVDRQYFDTASPVTVKDPAWGRTIRVSKRGSGTTVVWNPWGELAKAMSDLADDEYERFVCVESANAGENAVTVAPGATHAIEAEVTVV
jgi:glucose-6-phosphate 1-epimerase